MITLQRIEELAAQEGVKRIAVENFLGTLQGMSQEEALANLAMDARSYKWNTATCRAIRLGILESKLG